jgi:hypothetical protein
MSLVKNSLIAGGQSLQTYLKDGNNLHTENVAEWIVLEDQGLSAATNYYWRLSERETHVQLMSLWAVTTNNITLKIQSRGVDLFPITISGVLAATGFPFLGLVLPYKYDILVNGMAAISRILITAKEVSIPEMISFSRQ